jgi:hypothetical protein
MNIAVNAPRLRTQIREARDLRAQGRTKTQIQNWLAGTHDLAGVARGGAGGASVSSIAFDSTERTTILAEVPA